MCNEIEGLYNKIIITIVPSCTGKKYHSFVAIGIVTKLYWEKISLVALLLMLAVWRGINSCMVYTIQTATNS